MCEKLNLNDDLNGATKLLNCDRYQLVLLEKYIRKFRRNYKRYFFYQNGNYANLPTDREINTYAIETLFLLIGI